MKVLQTILSLMYGGATLYTGYMAIMHLFVYFANTRLGHEESLRLPMIYLICAVVFGTVTYIGYKLGTGTSLHFIFKALFYLPVAAVLLYILWAVLLVISSGGKWN
jgi:hypothetical protein